MELGGRLVIQEKYGPPNYGENPETDEKVEVPILVLSRPINVRGDPKGSLNSESFQGVKEVQLVFLSDKNITYSHLDGKGVVASGRLFQKTTGHHYTDILMIVDSIHEQ